MIALALSDRWRWRSIVLCTSILSLVTILGFLQTTVFGDGLLPTNQWVDFYSADSTYRGIPLPIGAVVAIFDSQGVKCGEFVVHTPGQYGIMPCYGDDPLTPEDEGAILGEPLRFTINGEEAIAVVVSHNGIGVPHNTVVSWSQSGDRWQVNLSVPITAVTPTVTPTTQYTDIEVLYAAWTECGIKVTWTTSYAEPNSYFVLERSSRVHGPFQVASSKIFNLGVRATYCYCDGRAIPGNHYYYRVRFLPVNAVTIAMPCEGFRYPLFLPQLKLKR